MKRITARLFSLSLLVTMLGLVGCETESSSQAAIVITPSSVTLGIGGSQEFVASGWTDYTWSISDSSAGTLSTTTGDSTVYTAVTALSSNTSQVLTCSGGVTTTTTNGSNTTTTATLEAQALILHQ